MKTFGIRFDGLQEPIEKLVKQYIGEREDQEFKYVEIGAGTGRTMRAIYDITKENIKHNNWKIVGLELCDGWSLDWKEVNKSFSQDELEVWTNKLSGTRLGQPLPKAQLWLDKNPRNLFQEKHWFNNIDICLIDGEHSRAYFMTDAPLSPGRHKLEISVRDRAKNESTLERIFKSR